MKKLLAFVLAFTFVLAFRFLRETETPDVKSSA